MDGPPLLALISLLALAPTPSPPPKERVLEGRWGGRGIGLSVAAEGGKIELDCAHAAIRPPLTVREDGTFRLPGTYFQERPGPTRQGQDDGEAAVYEGSTDGKTLTLKILLENGTRTLGPYTLALDASARIRKCQ